MAHTCNIFCKDDLHAVCVLRKRPDHAPIVEDYHSLGFEVVHIRQATEVHLDDWRAQMTHCVTIQDGVRVRLPITDRNAMKDYRYAFLVFLRRKGGR